MPSYLSPLSPSLHFSPTLHLSLGPELNIDDIVGLEEFRDTLLAYLTSTMTTPQAVSAPHTLCDTDDLASCAFKRECQIYR